MSLDDLMDCLPELLEWEVLRHLAPPDVAALLATTRRLYAPVMRARLWAGYTRTVVPALQCRHCLEPARGRGVLFLRVGDTWRADCRWRECPLHGMGAERCWVFCRGDCVHAYFHEWMPPSRRPWWAPLVSPENRVAGVRFHARTRHAPPCGAVEVWEDDWRFACLEEAFFPAWPQVPPFAALDGANGD